MKTRINEEIKKALENFSNGEKERKLQNYKDLNKDIIKDQILFTGSSLMEHFPIMELVQCDETCDKIVYNRGIAGYTTDEYLQAIDAVCIDVHPSKIFINIGTNDMNDCDDDVNWYEHLEMNYTEIMSIITDKLPECQIYMMTYYPINETIIQNNDAPMAAKFKTRSMAKVCQANDLVKSIADKFGATYIDVNDGLCDEQGQLRSELTVEGIHMYAEGYKIVYENLKEYL